MGQVLYDPTLGKHICHKQDEVNQFLKDQMLNNFSEQLCILFNILFHFLVERKKRMSFTTSGEMFDQREEMI
jgi:hypothetical protein